MSHSWRELLLVPIVVGTTAMNAHAQEPVTDSLGDSQADLLYTPLPPCRILDTRVAGGAIAAGTTRSFLVTGNDHGSQGGSPTGCSVPSGATAAMINFVAVNPAGPGDIRVTPFGAAIPLAAVVNYAAVPGLNIANGLAVTICNPAATTCTFDFTVQADVSGTELVADVQGYFRSPVTEPLTAASFAGVVVPPAGATPVQLAAVTFTATATGQVIVRARGHCSLGPAGASDDAIELAIGPDAALAFITPASQWGILRIPVNAGAFQLMFTAERTWPAGRGFTYSLGLFARHAVGSVADQCSGTLTVTRNM